MRLSDEEARESRELCTQSLRESGPFECRTWLSAACLIELRAIRQLLEKMVNEPSP